MFHEPPMVILSFIFIATYSALISAATLGLAINLSLKAAMVS